MESLHAARRDALRVELQERKLGIPHDIIRICHCKVARTLHLDLCTCAYTSQLQLGIIGQCSMWATPYQTSIGSFAAA